MKNKRKESQASKVRKYLEAGNSITPIDALKMFGSFRLAAIICNLKKDLKWMADKEIVTTMLMNLKWKNHYNIITWRYWVKSNKTICMACTKRDKLYVRVAEYIFPSSYTSYLFQKATLPPSPQSKE